MTGQDMTGQNRAEAQCTRSNGVIFIGLLLFRFTDKLLMSSHAHRHTHTQTITTHTYARKMQCYKFIIYVALSFAVHRERVARERAFKLHSATIFAIRRCR